MRVRSQERLWWSPTLTVVDSAGAPVVVAATGWEASFDAGVTWKVSRDNGGRAGWLIAGANYPGAGDSAGAITADHVLTATIQPLVRLRSAPETIINGDLWLTD